MITLNYRDAKPIYEQIKDGFRRLIFSGVLAEDSKLPSVRELAQQLSINPNTIQRAYRELEAEGCLYSIPGKGSFVQKTASISEAKRDTLFAALDQAALDLYNNGVNLEEICAHISAHLKGRSAT